MASSSAKKVLLIGWDAADWKIINPLIEAGKMPALERLVNKGVMGNIATLNPALSPMLWTSIATGVRPFRHGIHGFTEPDPDTGGIRPVSSRSRKVKAIWNILNQNGLKSNVIGWWPSHPAEPIDGVMVSNLFQRAHSSIDQPWEMPPGAVHPARLFSQIANLRIHPAEISAEQILPFIPRAAEIDPEKDQRVAALCRILADCASVQSCATAVMQLEPWDFMAIYYDAIDHFCHGFMKYHPPRQRHIPEDEFELYKGVVEGGYRFHDMMLGVLMELAGEETTIILVSDHGFHPDHLRPARLPSEPAGPAVEHRPYGIFVMSGPGIKKDELIFGASLLDITPTVLTLFGLPVGSDMQGKPLIQAFEEPPSVEAIPSWEDREGHAGQHVGESPLDPEAAQEAVRQLVALGYIDEPGEDQSRAVKTSLRESRYNLARDYMDANRHCDAVPLLEALWSEEPEELRFADCLAHCYLALSRLQECRALVETLFATKERLAEESRRKLETLDEKTEFTAEERREIRRLIDLANPGKFGRDSLMGALLAAEGKPEEALRSLQRALHRAPHLPEIHIQIGTILNKTKKWNEAEQAFRQALRIDPDAHFAYLGLSKSLLLQQKNPAAADAALNAIGLLYHLPQAHFLLGRALMRMGELDRAVEAFRITTLQHPGLIAAHEKLAYLYQHHLEDDEKAAQCRERIASLKKQKEARSVNVEREPMNRSVPGRVRVENGKIPETAACVDEKGEGAPRAEGCITVVSGLPRSGTSMVMQMLAAGGFPCLTDGVRKADESNPKGYFELEKIKRLAKESGWVSEARGKAIKVISHLLRFLPDGNDYRVILMERDLNEVVRSQTRMLKRLGESDAMADERALELYENHLINARVFLHQKSNFDVLEVSYSDALTHPQTTAQRINTFLGGHLDEAKMAQAVVPGLCQNRSGNL